MPFFTRHMHTAGMLQPGNFKATRNMIVVAAALALLGCAGVRQEDQDAWVGVPVSELDLHPLFSTMPVVRTTAADGTEMRNYVNSETLSTCSGGGTIRSGYVSSAVYNEFHSCVSTKAACNNIFYINNGVVTAYVPTGSGGARCYTDETTRPGFRGAVNVR